MSPGTVTGAAADPQATPRRGRLALYSVLALLVLLGAYSDHFENSFHYDDIFVIEGNIYLRSLKNLPAFFRQATTLSTAPGANAYRPLASASFALDYAWGGGLNVVAFHATQLSLHLLTALLCGLFARRLLRRCGAEPWAGPLALFGAAFFAVHLVQTEILNIITLRSEILSTLGALGSLCVYEWQPRLRRTGLWLLPMVAGAFAKPPSLMLAPLLAAYLALLPPPEPGGGPAAPATRFRHAAAAFAVAAGMYLLLERMGGRHLAYGFVPRGVYLQTQVFSWLHYLRLYALPLGLTVDWNWPPIDRWYDTRVLIGVLFNGLFVAGALEYARRRPPLGRLFLFGSLWFYCALAPASSVVPLPDMVATYRTYFPFIGLMLCSCAAAAELLQWARRTGRIALPARLAVAGALLIGAHAAAAYQRNRDFLNEKTLWQSVVRMDPGNARAWSAMGIMQVQERQYGEARRCLETSLRLRPGQYLPYLQLGKLEIEENHLDRADADIRRAMAIAPTQSGVYLALAELLSRQGRRSEVPAALEQALALAPASLLTRQRLLHEYRGAGDVAAYCRLAEETRRLADDPALERDFSALCRPAPAGP